MWARVVDDPLPNTDSLTPWHARMAGSIANDIPCKSQQDSVVYVHSAELLKRAEKNPRISGRVKIAKLISRHTHDCMHHFALFHAG